MVHYRPRRPVVQRQLALDGQADDPPPRLADPLRRPHRHEVGALRQRADATLRAVLEERVEALRVRAVDKPARDACNGRHPRRQYLCRHAPGAEAAARALRVHLQGAGVLHDAQRLGRGVGARVRRVQEVDVGEQEQPVGPELDGGEGREVVVVAEAQLLRARAVVLVDDGHEAERQALADRLLHVVPVPLLHEVALVDEELRDHQLHRAEEVLVHPHQLALAGGCHGLLGPQRRGLLLEAQLDAAHTHCARGDEDHLIPLPP
mmetsp:Transcript_103940/g.294505  ORF Transcript_103940/g.294505 Transcript_103940/m.294505 type:complete len:263 (-) Transcript_103940:183-971(-)